MFSYYGSKSKIVDLYPPPKFDRIIEPFAGSARYSLKYWQKDVLLVDKNETIIDIWLWLQQCSKQDILKFPKFKKGDDIRCFGLSEIEVKFLGFLVAGQGAAAPQYIVQKFGEYENGNQKVYERVANNLERIKHWTIQLGTYDEIPNFEATWFIDPPYQFGGEYYRYSNKDIDFDHLGIWCQNRTGQVIVCENTKADWLPFKPMVDMQGAMFKTTEAIWSNHKTNYDAVQQSLQF